MSQDKSIEETRKALQAILDKYDMGEDVKEYYGYVRLCEIISETLFGDPDLLHIGRRSSSDESQSDD